MAYNKGKKQQFTYPIMDTISNSSWGVLCTNCTTYKHKHTDIYTYLQQAIQCTGNGYLLSLYDKLRCHSKQILLMSQTTHTLDDVSTALYLNAL